MAEMVAVMVNNPDVVNPDVVNPDVVNPDGTVTPATPKSVDTHRVFPVSERKMDGTFPMDSRVGWIVWIYYQEPAPANRGLTLGTSGFTVKVYVDGTHQANINDSTSIVQTAGTDDQGKPDHSIQFFVSTRAYEDPDASNKIKIEVTGLTPYVRNIHIYGRSK